MKTITATLAALLLAGVSTAALAQDRDHDRGDRGQPQDHQQGPQAPQGGHARPGAPPGQQAAPPAARAAAGQGSQAAPPAQQPRFDRGGPSGVAQRQFDHERGPREVIPPTAERGGERGFDGRRDGHEAGARIDSRDGRHDDRRDGDRRDGDRRDGDRRDARNPWRGGEHWQPGRAPPVFWSQNRYRIGGYRPPYGYYVRTWGFGDFLPRGWYGQNYWLGDFLDYDLPYPPPGYEWVRVGGDALMIDRYTGRIVQVVRGIFW